MPVKITITGKVHDVGYRLFLLEEADSLFIPRFDAKNVRIDGKEALVVLVDGEEEQIREFVEFVEKEKPENAVVEEIRVEEYSGRVRDIDRFRNSFNTAQLSKIVQVGLQMLGKQDQMLEKQDEMLYKQDSMLGKMDLMLERQDKMLEKQDEMLYKQDSMLGKMDLMLERQDKMLEKQDETIKVIREESEKTRGEIRAVSSAVSSKLDRTNELLERRFQRLEEEIEKIKRALIKAGIEI
jgi:acylphosphatase